MFYVLCSMIVGHKKQWEYLQRAERSGKMPHALLFCGQEHLGKRTLAVDFLKKIFGENIFLHPDFIFLEPIENEIQISQIRELNWKLSLRSFSALRKAVIIDRAHLMNKEAQNCFLKTLEEPKGETLLIFVTEYPELLLPTIRSRVQKIIFFPVGKKELENYLKGRGLPEKEVAVLSELSQGRPGVAMNFLNDPQKFADFKREVKEIVSIACSDLGRRFEYAKELAQKEDITPTLHIWQSLFRNIMLSGLGLQKKWAILKKEYSLEKMKIILKNIHTTIFLTSTTNVNKRLALELFLIEL